MEHGGRRTARPSVVRPLSSVLRSPVRSSGTTIRKVLPRPGLRIFIPASSSMRSRCSGAKPPVFPSDRGRTVPDPRWSATAPAARWIRRRSPGHGHADDVEQNFRAVLKRKTLSASEEGSIRLRLSTWTVNPCLVFNWRASHSNVSPKSPWYSTAGLSSCDRLRDFSIAS
jgi:hypothetical protein